MQRLASYLASAALFLLFAFAFWLRSTSLESLPDISGDEVWHAIQLTHMLRGEPYSLWTATDLPLSPIHAGLELPLLLGLKPSLALVRIPALLTGTLAVLLTYLLGARMLDRRTALIASAIVAIMPVAIIFSRISYESSHAPFFGILFLYLAYQLRIRTLVLIFPFCYFIHPTNIFLLPTLLAVVAVRSLQEPDLTPRERWRRLALRGSALTAVVAAIGLYTMLRPSTQRLSKVFDTGLRGTHDFLGYWSNVERFFLGGSPDWSPYRAFFFWGALLLVLDQGVRQLVRDRRWERLAFVAGPILSALALFLMGGSNIIKPAATRYGLFLVVPSAIALASLLDSLLVVPRDHRRRIFRGIQVAALLVVAWSSLLTFDLRGLNGWAYTLPAHRNPSEDPWTFRNESVAPLKTVAEIVRRDLPAAATSVSSNLTADTSSDPRTVILSEGWWMYGPLEWLLISRRDIQVKEYHEDFPLQQPKIERMLATLQRGGYALGFPGTEVDNMVRLYYSPAMLRQWEILHRDQRHATLFRLNPSIPVPGDYDGDGRVELALFRPASAEWFLPSTGLRPTRLGDPGRDVPVPGDYDGDGRTDLAVYRPMTGEWRIPCLGETPIQLGMPGRDVPVPGDYDGDGRTDLAIFRVMSGEWFIPRLGPEPRRSPHPGYVVPIPGDYDGDGRTDVAAYRHGTSEWFIPALGPAPILLGDPGRDVPVPADYDGDGRTDLAVYRPGTGNWFTLGSARGELKSHLLGVAVVDQPAPGDYDGDGRTDLAVYSPSRHSTAVLLAAGGSTARSHPAPGPLPSPARGWQLAPDSVPSLIAEKPTPSKTVR